MANPLICVFNPITTLIDQIASASAGPGVAGSPVVLNQNGLIDPSLVGTGLTAIAGESISGGRLVTLYSFGGTLHMELSYADVRGSVPPDGGSDRPLPAIGFITTGVAINNTGLVQFSGVFTYVDPNAEFTSADISAEVYLSATSPFSSNGGGITKTRPSGVGQLQQTVGTVVGFTAPNFVQVAFVPLPQPPLLNFSNISTGTNTSATMTVGTGSTLTLTGSGIINSNEWTGDPINTSGRTTGQVMAFNGTTWVPSVVIAHELATTGAPVVIDTSAPPSVGQALIATSPTAASWQNVTASSIAFNLITGGTNTTAAMVVGSGATLTVTGTGVIEATELATTGSPVIISTNAPTGAGQTLITTSTTNATWQTPTAAAGGVPTQIQYNLAGSLAGIAGSTVATSGEVSLTPTGAGATPALAITGDGTNDALHVTDGVLTQPVLVVAGSNGNNYAPVTVGNGTGIGNDVQLSVLSSSTADVPTLVFNNIGSQMDVNITGVSNSTWMGIINRVVTAGTGVYNTEPIIGLFNFIANGSTGNVSTLLGGHFAVNQAGVGSTATLVLGVEAVVSVTDGTATELTSFSADNTVANAKTATNSYGHKVVFGTGANTDVRLTRDIWINSSNNTTSTVGMHEGVRIGFAANGWIGSNTGLVIEDMSANPGIQTNFTLSAAANASGGNTVYTGTFQFPANFSGATFHVSGFTNSVNNGAFAYVSNTATTLTLANANGTAEATAAVATVINNLNGSSIVTNGGKHTLLDQVDISKTITLPISSGVLTLTSVTTVDTNGNAFYNGTITGGANNGFAGRTFVIAGFTISGNNGQFDCVASTATYLVLNSPAASAETHAATAKSISFAPTGLQAAWSYGSNENLDGPIGNVITAGISGASPGVTVIDGFIANQITSTIDNTSITGGFTAVQIAGQSGGAGGGTLDSMTGLSVVADTGNNYTTTLLTGVSAQVVAAIEPTTTARAIYAQVESINGAVVTNAYGLYIDAPNLTGGGTITNDWGIFVASGASQFTGVATAIVTKSTTYTATADDHTINCTGTFTLTLPTTGLKVGQEFYIKNISTGTITISSAVNIDFATFTTLTSPGQSIVVQWDGTQYWIY